MYIFQAPDFGFQEILNGVTNREQLQRIAYDYVGCHRTSSIGTGAENKKGNKKTGLFYFMQRSFPFFFFNTSAFSGSVERVNCI